VVGRRRAGTEIEEPDVAIRPMTAGGEVVEDYRHVGLSLRRHPVEFLRADLAGRRIVTCAEAMAARDGRWLEAAGLVLVRQRPGSAKGVMFITIEDETGVANLVVWPSLFERQRRVVLSAGMMAARGKIQREGAVVHLVAHHLTDLRYFYVEPAPSTVCASSQFLFSTRGQSGVGAFASSALGEG
jgi:DNA polymerase III alpha subunit